MTLTVADLFARPLQDLQVAATRQPIVVPARMRTFDGRAVPLSFGLSDRFTVDAVVSLSTLTEDTANVLRVSQPGELECFPCVDFATVGVNNGRFDMRFGDQTVLSVSVTQLLARDYFAIESSLADRVMRLKIYQGTTKAVLVGQKTVSYQLNFPSHAERALYFAKGVKYNAHGAYSTGASVRHTLLGGARAYFRVSGFSPILVNAIQTNGTGTLTSMLPAYGSVNYADMFPVAPAVSPLGPGPGLRAVCFNGESALIHSVVDSRFVLDGDYNTGLSTCAWIKRTDTIDTLFTTFLDGAHQLRLFTWLDEISGLVHGHNALDIRTGTNLAIGSWSHVCLGAALGAPAKLWVNGSVVSSETEIAITSPGAATRPMAIGGSSNLDLHTTWGIDRGAKACMSEIVVYGRLISNSDAQRLYHAGLHGDAVLNL